MSLGRRQVSVDDSSRWVFNRMADVYGARPPYPAELLEALSELVDTPSGVILDVGAGVGHLAVPLSERGHRVMALEPARSMLEELEVAAQARGLELSTHHGAAEAIPLPDESVDLVVVADALHFLNQELAAPEIERVMRPRTALAVVTVEFADTPFMNALQLLIDETTDRRRRDVAGSVVQLGRRCGVALGPPRRILDETSMSLEELQRVLASISFLGPALSPERATVFAKRLEALPGPRVWSRAITLHAGRRSRRQPPRVRARGVSERRRDVSHG